VLALERTDYEWSDALKGAAEKKSSSNIGAVLGARGCITQVQAPDPSPAVCAPGIYLISVAWQGFDQTTAPANACGRDSYGTDTYRRVISTQVTVGLTGCL
jgi:type IV pilus assembly protein PilV